MPEVRSLRVLQFIGDTDALGSHLAAIALHRELAGLGLEVRTLALAPGPHGGLELDVPAVAPNRRSIAARGQVLHESKWADVVVLHAPRALTLATLGSRRAPGPPTVVAVWEPLEGPPLQRRSIARRVVGAAARVVVPSPEAVDSVATRFGRTSGVEVAVADLHDEGRPQLDGIEWARLLSTVVP